MPMWNCPISAQMAVPVPSRTPLMIQRRPSLSAAKVVALPPRAPEAGNIGTSASRRGHILQPGIQRRSLNLPVGCAAYNRRQEETAADAAAAMEAGWGQKLLGGLAAVSTLGSVAGAVAAVVTEQLMFAYFPIALPVVALLANAQRERIRSQVGRSQHNCQCRDVSSSCALPEGLSV